MGNPVRNDLVIVPYDEAAHHHDVVVELAYSIEFPLVRQVITASDIALLFDAETGLYSHTHFKLALDEQGELLGILNTRLLEQDSPTSERRAFRQALGWRGSVCFCLRALWHRENFLSELESAHALHIEHIAIVDGKRNLGIGASLMEYALDEARAAGVEYVDLEVLRSNTGAQRFYVNHGFRYPDGVDPGADPGVEPGVDPNTPAIKQGFWRFDDAFRMHRDLL
jgi:ribosomal protein S18 acetylase RimI-like enzyme